MRRLCLLASAYLVGASGHLDDDVASLLQSATQGRNVGSRQQAHDQANATLASLHTVPIAVQDSRTPKEVAELPAGKQTEHGDQGGVGLGSDGHVADPQPATTTSNTTGNSSITMSQLQDMLSSLDAAARDTAFMRVLEATTEELERAVAVYAQNTGSQVDEFLQMSGGNISDETYTSLVAELLGNASELQRQHAEQVAHMKEALAGAIPKELATPLAPLLQLLTRFNPRSVAAFATSHTADSKVSSSTKEVCERLEPVAASLRAHGESLQRVHQSLNTTAFLLPMLDDPDTHRAEELMGSIVKLASAELRGLQEGSRQLLRRASPAIRRRLGCVEPSDSRSGTTRSVFTTSGGFTTAFVLLLATISTSDVCV